MQELEKQLWSVETKSHNPEYIDAVGQKKTFTIQYEIAKLDSKKFNRLQELLSERRAEVKNLHVCIERQMLRFHGSSRRRS